MKRTRVIFPAGKDDMQVVRHEAVDRSDALLVADRFDEDVIKALATEPVVRTAIRDSTQTVYETQTLPR